MTTNLKRIIGQIKDQNELREIERACAKRRTFLREQEYAKEVSAKWETIQDLPKGTTLHVCAAGTFFGGPFQRGDSMELLHIQPRALRIWVKTTKGDQFHMDCRMVHRYDLCTNPPASPMQAEERERVKAMAERISAIA